MAGITTTELQKSKSSTKKRPRNGRLDLESDGAWAPTFAALITQMGTSIPIGREDRTPAICFVVAAKDLGLHAAMAPVTPLAPPPPPPPAPTLLPPPQPP